MQTVAKVLRRAGTMSEYSEIEKIEKEFQMFKTIVRDVGGIGKLSNEKYEEIEQFCRRQNPKCPQCGERNTKFRYIENKDSARTLQPRFKCSVCKVGEENKEREFTWGGKQYRERVTEQSNIHQEPQDYQTQDMPDGVLWNLNTAGVWLPQPHLYLGSESTDVFEKFPWENTKSLPDPPPHEMEPNEGGISIDDFEVCEVQFK